MRWPSRMMNPRTQSRITMNPMYLDQSSHWGEEQIIFINRGGCAHFDNPYPNIGLSRRKPILNNNIRYLIFLILYNLISIICIYIKLM